MADIPVAAGAVPVVGHGVGLLRDPWRFVTSLPPQGGVLRLRLGPIQAVMVCEHELTAEVLADDRTFDKGGPLFDRVRDLVGDGLSACGHDTHRRLRPAVQPAFHRSRLPGYATLMSARHTQLIESWRAGQILDVPAAMGTLAAATLVDTLFTDSIRPEQIPGFMRDVQTLVAGVAPRAILPPVLTRLPLPSNRRYYRARARLYELVEDIITTRRRESDSTHPDLLDALLAAHTTSTSAGGRVRGRISDSEIRDQIVTFLIAGAQTVADTLAWALYLLATHPDIQQRLHAETRGVLGEATAGYEDLPHLRLAGRVITETLRLYPPTWLLTRTLTGPATLAGYSLPAGTIVAFSPYLLHRHPHYYPEPDVFDPDRWLPDRNQAPATVIIPYGAGPRKCIGDYFAATEMTLALATITARWQLHPTQQQPVRPKRGIGMTPHTLHLRTEHHPTQVTRS